MTGRRPSCFPVVVTIFLHGCSHIGVFKAVAFLQKDMERSLHLDNSSTGLGVALGVYMAVSILPAPIISECYRRCPSPRAFRVCGPILASLGIILCAFSTRPWHMVASLGLSGLGHSVITLCGPVELHKLAEDNFNLLFSISRIGYGVGMVLLPVMADFLMTAYGWRGAMLVIGGFIANTIPFAIAIRTPDRTRGNITNEEANLLPEENYHGSSSSSSLKHLNSDPMFEANSTAGKLCFIEKVVLAFKDSDFYRDPFFNFFFISTMLNYLVYSSWHAFLVPFGTSRGLSLHQAVIMTAFAAAGNISGRLISGVITHRLCSPIMLYLVLTLIDLLNLLLTVVVHNVYVLIAVPFVSSFCIASTSGLASMIVRERASYDRYSTAEAFMLMCMGVGSLVGCPISGLIADTFSSYDATFIFLIAVDGAVLLTTAPAFVMKKPHHLAED